MVHWVTKLAGGLGFQKSKPLILKFGVEELEMEVLYFLKHVLHLKVLRRRGLRGIRKQYGWGANLRS